MTMATALVVHDAQAGRPLSTEDAGVLEAGRCQLESWVDRSRDVIVGWFVPACNVGGGIEWQVGAARMREAGESRFQEAYLQAKKVLLEASDGVTSIGLVLGVTRQPLNEAGRGWENPYAVLPISHAVGPAQVHFNVGWSRDKATRRDTTIWGLAGEWPVDRWTAVAEVFGENSERPSIRAGFRWTALPDTLEIDLTWVTRPGGERSDRYVSLGFTLLTPTFAR